MSQPGSVSRSTSTTSDPAPGVRKAACAAFRGSTTDVRHSDGNNIEAVCEKPGSAGRAFSLSRDISEEAALEAPGGEP
jgi:hypothetical protein